LFIDLLARYFANRHSLRAREIENFADDRIAFALVGNEQLSHAPTSGNQQLANRLSPLDLFATQRTIARRWT
jgi:hypothetical protein